MSGETIELPRDVVMAWREGIRLLATQFSSGPHPKVAALAEAIDAVVAGERSTAMWEPPVATIPWASTRDHAHPIGQRFLGRHTAGWISSFLLEFDSDEVTHWCLLPEADR